ncbi:MAG: zinc-ribbon domain-containing protein [Candidatus Odinarchaeota archaeon]
MSPYCINCGNKVEDSWNICPNCGKALKEQQVPQIQPQQQIPQQSQLYREQPYQRTFTRAGNSYGTTALICGLLGMIFGIFYIGIVLGIIAIIMGGIGLSKDESPSMATIGLVLGIFDFILFFIFFFFLFSWLNWIWNWFP